MRISFLNPQGNFDNNDLYWTEHPDFGGQLVYVKEVAIEMAKMGIEVDIITRQIIDKNFPGFEKKLDYYKGVDNLRIIRIPFGGKKFLNKEKLWNYIDEYVDGIINFYKKEGEYPDFFTGHYGDGGLAGALLYKKLDIPYTFTGHSLGAQKMDKLNVNRDNISKMDEKYNFSKRIMAERLSIANSAVNIVSTSQERYEQYSHNAYNGAVDVNNDLKFKIIPPGVNIDMFNKDGKNEEEDFIKDKIKNMFNRDINKNRLDLPAVIAASRLDPKKNHVGLVKAYAENKELQEKCNLVITLRGIDNPFKDYSNAREKEKKILDEIMEIINKYDLKGKVCMFSLNSQKQLAATYREFARRDSIFTLTALYEPFGLAPIEAMACGLPAVVTKNGGPSEVLKEGDKEFGVLVDPNDTLDISNGILKMFKYKNEYKKLGIKRVYNKFTWENTAKGYIDIIKRKRKEKINGKDFNKFSIHPYFKNPKNNDKITLDKLKKIYFEGGE